MAKKYYIIEDENHPCNNNGEYADLRNIGAILYDDTPTKVKCVITKVKHYMVTRKWDDGVGFYLDIEEM